MYLSLIFQAVRGKSDSMKLMKATQASFSQSLWENSMGEEQFFMKIY